MADKKNIWQTAPWLRCRLHMTVMNGHDIAVGRDGKPMDFDIRGVYDTREWIFRKMAEWGQKGYKVNAPRGTMNGEYFDFTSIDAYKNNTRIIIDDADYHQERLNMRKNEVIRVNQRRAKFYYAFYYEKDAVKTEDLTAARSESAQTRVIQAAWQQHVERLEQQGYRIKQQLYKQKNGIWSGYMDASINAEIKTPVFDKIAVHRTVHVTLLYNGTYHIQSKLNEAMPEEKICGEWRLSRAQMVAAVNQAYRNADFWGSSSYTEWKRDHINARKDEYGKETIQGLFQRQYKENGWRIDVRHIFGEISKTATNMHSDANFLRTELHYTAPDTESTLINLRERKELLEKQLRKLHLNTSLSHSDKLAAIRETGDKIKHICESIAKVEKTLQEAEKKKSAGKKTGEKRTAYNITPIRSIDQDEQVMTYSNPNADRLIANVQSDVVQASVTRSRISQWEEKLSALKAEHSRVSHHRNSDEKTAQLAKLALKIRDTEEKIAILRKTLLTKAPQDAAPLTDRQIVRRETENKARIERKYEDYQRMDDELIAEQKRIREDKSLRRNQKDAMLADIRAKRGELARLKQELTDALLDSLSK